ncbi:hypothetical protein [Spirillospora sp. CA-294931]|uniref:hypothetical protein n=1 Tax=Spirillospora sp. CA-294931 TaxID=3240042 RepID=UPI003D9469A8
MKDAENAEAQAAMEAERERRRAELIAEYPIFAEVDPVLMSDIVTSDWHWREGHDQRWRLFAENRVDTIEERRGGRRVGR